MTENSAKRRNSLTTKERAAIRERTDRTAQETLAEERRRREAKTARLKAARLQAEQQSRQL